MVDFKVKKVSPEVKDLKITAGHGVDLYARDAYLRRTKGGHILLCYCLGIMTELPEDVYASLVPRSSISEYSIVMPNSPGKIDHNFRGEWEMRCRVIGDVNLEDYFFNDSKIAAMGKIPTNRLLELLKAPKLGERVAQFYLEKWNKPEPLYVDSLEESDRTGGFGSTGTGLED